MREIQVLHPEERDWYLRHSPVEAAYNHLEGLCRRSASQRRIVLHPRSEVPLAPGALWYATVETHHIFIDRPPVTEPHSLVHELVHAALMEEGYHVISGCFSREVTQLLANELQHPEVFRRMENFGLDMAAYWKRWEVESRGALYVLTNRWTDSYSRSVHLPRIYPWFWFPQASAMVLEEYRAFDPVVFEFAQRAFNETVGIGFATVGDNRRSLEIFRQHWANYCQANLPQDDNGQRIAGMVATSDLKPAARNAILARDHTLYSDLVRMGLREK